MILHKSQYLTPKPVFKPLSGAGRISGCCVLATWGMEVLCLEETVEGTEGAGG